MKLTKYIMIGLSAAALVSCNNWLDITPEDTVVENKLFKDASGYHAAINGLYQLMGSESLYGRNLSWGFASALSQYYDNASANDSKAFSTVEKYDYASSTAKDYGEQIWTTAFNVVANANNIIKHVDAASPSIFPDYENEEANIIKGEAIAVRALMHFEMLRYFAPAPAENASAPAIPYVESFPSMFNDRKTVSEVVEKIETDLEAASELLARHDTTKVGNSYMYNMESRYMVSNSSRNFFFTGRGTRLNYVGVRSLLARVKWYAGDKAGAAEVASAVIDEFVDTKKWYAVDTKFTNQETSAARPHKMMNELLVSIYNDNLSVAYSGSARGTLKSNPYALKNIDGIFADNDDYRKSKLVDAVDLDTKISLKYLERSGTSNSIKMENSVIPVMKLSELYLIVADNLADTGDMPGAVKIVNDLRTIRGCAGNKLTDDMTLAAFRTALRNEYCRENVAEGQYFFYCKQINAPTINNNGVWVPMEGKYTMPVPDSETSLN